MNLFETMPGHKYSMIDDRCFSHDGAVVDLGCRSWDWSKFFIGKKRVIGVDPYETNIQGAELYQGVIYNETKYIPMSDAGVSSNIFDEGKDLIYCLSWQDFCQKFNIDKISVLKINIEGAEYGLLQSMKPQDFEKIDQIAVSFHDWMNHES